MSSLATCPYGFVLNNGVCFSTCPPGTIELESNPSYCVSTVTCQTGTIPDVSGAACLKVAPIGITSLTGGSCTSGYTEWVAGDCYINCNAFFLENATQCNRKLLPRRTAEPWCTSWFSYVQNNTCELNVWSVIVVVVLSLLLLYLVFSWWKPNSLPAYFRGGGGKALVDDT